jgi:mannose/fructose/N-acetylgalactosamine-specific phosphotransferase system component IIC
LNNVLRVLLRASAVALFMAILVGATFMYIAWADNAQQEIHNGEGGNIDWAYWLGIGASWAVATFVVVELVAILAFAAWPRHPHGQI